MQVHGLAAFGALEDGGGLFHAGFKFGFHAGLHINLRNLEDHGGAFAGGDRQRRGIMIRAFHSEKRQVEWAMAYSATGQRPKPVRIFRGRRSGLSGHHWPCRGSI